MLDTRWFHTTGHCGRVGEHTGDEVVAALKAAKEKWSITSYDLNYRSTLWDIEEARKMPRRRCPMWMCCLELKQARYWEFTMRKGRQLLQ